jgi:hypothetical protein
MAVSAVLSAVSDARSSIMRKFWTKIAKKLFDRHKDRLRRTESIWNAFSSGINLRVYCTESESMSGRL